MSEPGYALRVLLALDRLGNTILGGSDEETISERSGKALDRSDVAKALCNALDELDANHCLEAADDLPPDERLAMRQRFEAWRALCVPILPAPGEAP